MRLVTRNRRRDERSRKHVRVVVGFDGGKSAQRALERVADLVPPKATVAIVHVIAPSQDVGTRLDTGVRATIRWQQEETLKTAARELHDRQINTKTVGRVGDPADELVAVARELHADLIIIGRNRRQRFERVPGETCACVIRESAVPVIVVP